MNHPDDYKHMTFKQFCELEGISSATAKRELKKHPDLKTQLSRRRIGIRWGKYKLYVEERERAAGKRRKATPATATQAEAS